MANICSSTYRITGEPDELDALYNLMLKISKEKENGYWVGHIVKALNDDQIPKPLYVRGWWEGITREENYIQFYLESAWEPLYQAWDFICGKFKTLSAYFLAEEPGFEIYEKRSHEKYGWFTENFYVDTLPPGGDSYSEYFDTIDEAFRYIKECTGADVATPEDVEALNLKWREEDEDAYIYLHEFEEV